MSATTKGQDAIIAACRALRTALEEDLSLGRRMLENARAEQAALIAFDHRLVSALEAEGQQIAVQQEANRLRREAAVRDAIAVAVPRGHDDGALPCLRDLAPRLPSSESRVLLALRGRILEVGEALRRVNERNRVLVQNALELVQFTFQTLADLSRRQSGYGVAEGATVAPAFYLDHRA